MVLEQFTEEEKQQWEVIKAQQALYEEDLKEIVLNPEKYWIPSVPSWARENYEKIKKSKNW